MQMLAPLQRLAAILTLKAIFCHSLICIGNVVTNECNLTEIGPVSTQTGWIRKYICNGVSLDLMAETPPPPKPQVLPRSREAMQF